MQTVELLSYILHHITLPLVQGLDSRAATAQTKEVLTDTLVSLLDKVIQQGEALKDVIEVDAEDKDNLALRMHVASLCAKIIADSYKKTGEIPSEANVHDIVDVIRTSLTYCEDYIPLQKLSEIYPENAHRPASFLQNLADLKYLESTIPLVNAVNHFSFGQPPQKMIQNVSKKLLSYVSQMRVQLLGSHLHDLELKEANRYILHNLAELYYGVHMAELKRIENLADNMIGTESSEQQIDNIWQAFEVRYEMLLELTETIVPENTSPWNDEFGLESGHFESIDDFLDDPFLETGDAPENAFKPMSFYTKKDEE